MAHDFEDYIDRAVEIIRAEHEVHKMKHKCTCADPKIPCKFLKGINAVDKAIRKGRKKSED